MTITNMTRTNGLTRLTGMTRIPILGESVKMVKMVKPVGAKEKWPNIKTGRAAN